MCARVDEPRDRARRDRSNGWEIVVVDDAAARDGTSRPVADESERRVIERSDARTSIETERTVARSEDVDL